MTAKKKRDIRRKIMRALSMTFHQKPQGLSTRGWAVEFPTLK